MPRVAPRIRIVEIRADIVVAEEGVGDGGARDRLIGFEL